METVDQGGVEPGFELVGRHVAAPADPPPPVATNADTTLRGRVTALAYVTGTAIAPIDALVAQVTPHRGPRAARR